MICCVIIKSMTNMNRVIPASTGDLEVPMPLACHQ